MLRSCPCRVEPFAAQGAGVQAPPPGLSGLSGLQLTSGNGGGGSSCSAASQCLPNPLIQEFSESAPNTVITEHAMQEFHIQANTADWLLQGTQPFTAAQVRPAAPDDVPGIIEELRSARRLHEIVSRRSASASSRPCHLERAERDEHLTAASAGRQ